MSVELNKQIDIFLKQESNAGGVKFPTGVELTKKRLKKQNPKLKDSDLKNITEDTPAVKTADLEINLAKTQLNTILAQAPFLATPITIPQAISVIKTQLPFTIKLLTNIGVEPPEALLPILTAINASIKILKAADAVLVPPLSPLKDLLGIKV